MADGKPPSEQDTEQANQETIRMSSGAEKRIWARMVMRGNTAYCYCGRRIDDFFISAHEVVIQHKDGWYNPLTCKFRGTITDEMREKIGNAKTDT